MWTFPNRILGVEETVYLYSSSQDVTQVSVSSSGPRVVTISEIRLFLRLLPRVEFVGEARGLGLCVGPDSTPSLAPTLGTWVQINNSQNFDSEQEVTVLNFCRLAEKLDENSWCLSSTWTS